MRCSLLLERTLLPDKPTLLLTNDDGYGAAGLVALEKALSGIADVYVLAPDSNRSAVSNHIIMNRPLSLTEIDSRHFTSEGNPVDCVVTALHSDLFRDANGLPVQFDAVFSGINQGPNMGSDTVYSGTVAAARQAVMYNTPGIAFSLDSKDGSWQYEALASFAAKNVRALIEFCTKTAFVNVNAPSQEKYEKVCYSSLCIRDYHDRVQIQEMPDGKRCSVFLGGSVGSHGAEHSDFATVERGAIAISRIPAENVAEACPEHFLFTV